MAAPPTRDLGRPDLIWGTPGQGLMSDWLETTADLMWPLSVRTYGRMRHDPQLKAVLQAYTLPIMRATWAIDPAGCRDEAVQMVADDLGLPVLGADRVPGPARRRGVRWVDHLRLALLHLVYGHMPFERRYDVSSGQARLVNLGERMPHTITEIAVNADGTLRHIRQEPTGTTEIPARRLVWYVHEREGANWAGTSILRPAFGPWLIKHEVWRVHATSIRRFGMGVPTVKAPPGATPAQVMEAQRLASAIRAGDTSGVGLPAGFELAISGMTGSAPDALAFIQYLDRQMSTMALAGLLDLGSTPNGSRALGESFLDLFLLSLQTVADDIAQVATSGHPGMPGIVTDIIDLNWGEDEPVPRVVVPDVGDRHEITAQAVKELVDSGAITPDAELEAFLRDAWRLPPPDPDRPAQPVPAAPPTPVAATPKRRPSGQLSAAAPKDGTGDALEALLTTWEKISKAQRAELTEQVRAAVEDDDPRALAALTVDTAAATAALTAALVAAYAAAGQEMAATAQAQGVAVEPPPPDTAALASIAAVAAGLLAAGLAAAAGREAMRLLTPGASPRKVAAAVGAYLADLTDRALRDQLGGALHRARNMSWLDVLELAAPDSLVATEVDDPSTCEPCDDIDGTVFETVAEAREVYGAGGYIGCQWGIRCRGTVLPVWGAPDG